MGFESSCSNSTEIEAGAACVLRLSRKRLPLPPPLCINYIHYFRLFCATLFPCSATLTRGPGSWHHSPSQHPKLSSIQGLT